MITNDATLLKVKHEVLYEVAKLAYAGRLEEESDSLPYKMVPGPQPAFRCCIYREREVIIFSHSPYSIFRIHSSSCAYFLLL